MLNRDLLNGSELSHVLRNMGSLPTCYIGISLITSKAETTPFLCIWIEMGSEHMDYKRDCKNQVLNINFKMCVVGFYCVSFFLQNSFLGFFLDGKKNLCLISQAGAPYFWSDTFRFTSNIVFCYVNKVMKHDWNNQTQQWNTRPQNVTRQGFLERKTQAIIIFAFFLNENKLISFIFKLCPRTLCRVLNTWLRSVIDEKIILFHSNIVLKISIYFTH